MTTQMTIIHLVFVTIVPHPMVVTYRTLPAPIPGPQPRDGYKAVLVNCDFFGVLLDFIFNLFTSIIKILNPTHFYFHFKFDPKLTQQ